MRPGSFQSGSGHLQEAMEKLQRRWADVCEHWDDANRREFEDNHLTPLLREASALLPAIGQISETVAAAVRELEEG
ncbi:MAG: hypothetical protein ACF8TS_11270 [Maioricimonas sp. JB049]